MILQDIYTGKRYIDNIPEGVLSKITDNSGSRYMIVAKSTTEGLDWYNKTWANGQFLGDCYAVYCMDIGDSRFYRVSQWYKTFGWARNKMVELANNKK